MILKETKLYLPFSWKFVDKQNDVKLLSFFIEVGFVFSSIQDNRMDPGSTKAACQASGRTGRIEDF